MAKALLSFRITVDHDGGSPRSLPVFSHIKLYREDDGLVWRIDGPYGDEAEALPRPKSVESAKADARAVFPKHSPFAPAASWM
jgi:hypothetical protein